MPCTRLFLPVAALVLAFPSQAAGQEVYGGVYAHGVDTPFTIDIGEGGVDLQGGMRFDEIGALGGAQPQLFGSVNLSGDTSFLGAGFSWKLDAGPVYFRPGMGLVIHDGPELSADESRMRTDLGSRILFSPEIAVGMEIDKRWSIEASWVHISNAQVFDKGQNPGIDMIGLRVNYRM